MGRAFPPERRRGRIGPVTAVQLIVVELAAVAIAVVVGVTRGRDVILLTAALFVANLLVVCVFLRSGGTWWYEQQLVRRRMRRRRRAARAALAAGGSPPDALAPGLAIRTVYDRASRIGVGQDSAGWYAVLEAWAPRGLRGGRSGALVLDRLAQLFAETAVPVSTLQVVSHTVPVPSAALDPAAPARQAYGELLGDETVVAYQALWVAVRLNPSDAAAAAASRGGGLAGVDRALAAAVGRVGKALAAAEVDWRVLDADALRAVLLTSCGPAGDPAGDAPTVDESWTAWQAGGTAYTCLRLTRWPRQSPESLFTALATVPATAVSLAVTLQPGGDRVAVRTLVRVAAPPEGLPAAVNAATAAARTAGARPRRVDGEHGPGVYATAPTGGGLL
jgi:type VII secretion protein EccE